MLETTGVKLFCKFFLSEIRGRLTQIFVLAAKLTGSQEKSPNEIA